MTITASFPLSMSAIATEYGASLPFSLRSVLGKPGLPTSGAVSFADCLGKSAGGGTAFTPDGGTTVGAPVAIANSNPTETIVCTAAATWTWTRNTGAGTSNVTTGGSASSITFTCPGAAGQLRTSTFTVSAVSGAVTRYWTVAVVNDQT